MGTLARTVRDLAAFALAAGCTCGGAGPGVVTDAARCAIADPPSARSIAVGDARLVVEASTVRIEGVTSPARIVAVVGPAVAGEPFAPALDAIEERDPDAVLVLGSLGDDEATRRDALGALATLSVPTLILPGARDELAPLRAAIAEAQGADRLVDLAGVRLIQVGDVILVPVPGAPDGRYARTDESCALLRADAETIASGMPEGAGAGRVLVSWAAPAGHSAARGAEGTDAGSELVRDLSTRLGALGGIAAWPPTALAAHRDGEVSWVIAAPAVGPAIEGPTGDRRASGPITVLVSSSGLEVEEPDAPSAP